MSNKLKGLYDKFTVIRKDGASSYGCKHHNCDYFVLDLSHDPHAMPALEAYAESCRVDYPRLSDDLLQIVETA